MKGRGSPRDGVGQSKNMLTNRTKGLRIAIDAALLPWRNGGIAHALISLVRALSELTDGDETYCLVVDTEEEAAFWQPRAGPNQTVVIRRSQESSSVRDGGILRQLRASSRAQAKRWFNRLRQRLAVPSPWPEVPVSDGFYESLGCDVMHFAHQRFVLCALPVVYNPHDLQHLHYPQFFTPSDLAWRETVYPFGCRIAQTVVVGSQWAKDDVSRQYGIDPAKIQVILEGADAGPTTAINPEAVLEVKRKYRLPEGYVLYAAMTWPHKNHLRLLEATALIRDLYGLVVPLVFTGSQRKDFYPEIEARVRELGLEKQVVSLGFVPDDDLRIILRSAAAFVQPSLFEASSLPIFDAWHEGIPVACSRATALPEQVQDAGVLFDPLDVREIADAIVAVTTDETRRHGLRERGFDRLKDFGWTRTARTYRAVYRRVAGRVLGDEDRALLAGRSPRQAYVSS
jgi:glycosyltransferase involved in cell wall biosynthesis